MKLQEKIKSWCKDEKFMSFAQERARKEVCEVTENHRIRFYRPDGTRGDSPGCGSILIAFGVENAEVLKNCSIEGKYVQLN